MAMLDSHRERKHILTNGDVAADSFDCGMQIPGSSWRVTFVAPTGNDLGAVTC